MACSAAMSVEELWEQQRAADGTGGVGEQSEATETTTATATARVGGADGQNAVIEATFYGASGAASDSGDDGNVVTVCVTSEPLSVDAAFAAGACCIHHLLHVRAASIICCMCVLHPSLACSECMNQHTTLVAALNTRTHLHRCIVVTHVCTITLCSLACNVAHTHRESEVCYS
jgi:hypothetical protein